MSEDNYYNTNAETPLYLINDPAGYKLTLPVPNRNITFSNANNEVVGTLDLNGKEMKFTGNADESAQIFIKWLKDWWGMENEK